jgi:hypothetical protein
MNDNKLIAEFMGYEITTDGISTLIKGDCYNVTPLPMYHLRWDYLMPVVEKIETLDCIEYVSITLNDVLIRIKGIDTIDYCRQGDKLYNTYSAVVEFIKWYNKQED